MNPSLVGEDKCRYKRFCDGFSPVPMKDVLYITAIVILLAVAIYGAFRQPNLTYIQNTTVVQSELPIRRLSGFVDAHADKIFSPLSDSQTVIPTQEIRAIREALIDLVTTSKEKEKRLYLEGVNLCESLLKAIESREAHNRRLADTLAKKPTSLEAAGKAQEEDIKRKSQFFHDAILRSWDIEVTRLREQFDKQYAYVRLLER